MSDAIGLANISHNSGQRIIRVLSASLSGDRGRIAAAAEGPWRWSPFAASRGSHKPLVLPEASKSIRYRGGGVTCMSSEHFGQLAWQFERMSGSSGLKVQAAIAC